MCIIGGRDRGPRPPLWLGKVATVQLAVDQAGYRTRARCVLLTMMAINLVEGLVAAHSTDAVFHHDALLSKGAIVEHVLGRTGLTARLTPRRGGSPLGPQLIDPDIGQVAADLHVRR